MPTGALIPTGSPVDVLFPHPVDGLWPAHEVSLLAGSSGVGKTTLFYQLLAAWSTGGSFAGFSGPPGPYGVIAADRTILAHKRTAAMVGLDWQHMVCRSLVDDEVINIKDLEHDPIGLMLNLLTNIRSQAPAVTLVLVDPMMVFLGVDLNKYNLVAAKMIPINRYCLKHKLTLIGTHHASKPRSDWTFKRPQDRIAGSGALLAYTSTQGFLAGADELDDNADHHCEWSTISHHHPPVTLKVIRNESGLFEPVGLKNQWNGATTDDQGHSHPAADHHPLLKLSHSASLILDAIPDGHIMSRSALTALAQSTRSGDRAIDELLQKGLLVKVAHGQYQKALAS